jgi:IclR family pca regulon transcriptional regulator
MRHPKAIMMDRSDPLPGSREQQAEMSDDRPKRSNYFMQSLARGIRVLETIADAAQPLSLTEISRATAFNVATITRCCHTLESLGFIRRNGQRRYNLTPKVLKLGYANVSRMGWLKAAKYRMERLSKRIGETVNLSMLDGTELLYIARIKTTKILPFDLHIGSKLPVHCTSMGKVLVAFSAPEKTREILAALRWEALTHRTIINESEFLAELQRVREKGYAINDEELSIGLRSAAVPVFSPVGRAVAALNIAVPTQRVSRRQLEEKFVPQAMETARKISRDIQLMGAD